MYSSSSNHPKRLRTLAANVEFPGRNTLLHRFVIDNSEPNKSGSANYINAVLLSMSDAPASVVNALNDDGYSALSLAVSKNNLLMVKKLLTCLANVDVDAIGWRTDGGTALSTASRLGLSSIIHELLHGGANIDVKEEYDETALCFATRSGHLDAMELLLSKGANVNAIGVRGTPLLEAVYKGNLAAVELLVRNGADVNLIPRSVVSTPLRYAVCSRRFEMVEYLVKNGADVNARDCIEETVLHSAVRRGICKIAVFLLDQGADVHARDGFANETPLHLAVRSRNHVITKFLKYSKSAWKRHDALRRGNLEIVKLLIEQGADLRTIDEEGRTPLHDAAVGGEDRKMVAFLSDPHADRGWMPHYDARYREEAKVIRKLLEKGADAHARNVDGKTPLDYTRNENCMMIYKTEVASLVNLEALFRQALSAD